MNNSIDILEDSIKKFGQSLLDILLKDKTTKKNIIWATQDYEYMGDMYKANKEILSELVTGFRTNVIQPRITKENHNKSNRTKEKAEVFTPAWVCNQQNNLVDERWFGRKDVFNVQNGTKWITNEEKIRFEGERDWQDYVDARRLEVSCGEAPYLVSRYDTVLGYIIPVNERIGLLDRKFRVINENIEEEKEWLRWSERAIQSIYGFEYQGDNLLLARENILYTFIDNMEYKFDHSPNLECLKRIANIIAWNIWQMDGTSYAIPYANVRDDEQQISIFDYIDIYEHNSWNIKKKDTDMFLCKIRDWRAEKTILYKELIEGVK